MPLQFQVSEYNIQKCLAPIHLMQQLLGTLRIDIRGSQVENPTNCQNTYVFFNVILGLLSMYSLLTDYYQSLSQSVILYSCFFCSITIYSICIFLNIFNARFINQEENVKLYITLQTIDSFISLNGNIYSSIHNYIINLTSVLVFACFYLGSFAYQYYLIIGKGHYVSPSCIYGGLGMFTLQLEMHLLGNLVYYLAMHLLALKEEFKTFVLNLYSSKKILNNGVMKLSYYDCSQMNNIIICLNTITKAFSTIGKLYRFQLFLVTTTIVIWTFIIIQAAYEGVRTELLPMPVIALIIFSILLEFFEIILVVLICKYFEKQIMDIRQVCFIVLDKTTETQHKEPLRSMVKRMLRITEKADHVISVYDIFTVNLSLPHRLLALVVSYVIVSMQFTLLKN